MSIKSMTGFGRGESANELFQVTVEVKSVNNRYKDFRFKMPSVFNSIENDLRSILQNYVSRGSVDIFVNYKKLSSLSKLSDIDMSKVEAYTEMFKNFELSFSPTDFIRSEFYKDEDLSQNETLMDLLKTALEEAASSLSKARQREGQKMKEAVLSHLESYKSYYAQIEPLTAQIESDVREKLKKRFSEFKDVAIDEPRFMQEVIYYLEKLDVHEEIDRINSHLEKLESLLESNGEVGRQIDFLIQELNRETNTIGSKSAREEISNNVVQMKVHLEKIREQGLNLE